MQTARTDYYEILGVPRTADDETIKRAFRAIARELHPDVSADPAAEEKFREASEAYAVLSKPATKLLYDRFGFRGRGNGWFGPPGRGTSGVFPEDLLERVFHPHRHRRGEAVAEVELDPYDAERGTRRTVDFTARVQCPDCGGDGAAPGALRSTCPVCGGTGRRKEETTLDEARLLQIETCPRCSGRGQLASEPCRRCEGAGRIQVERSVELKIPAGVEDGERLELGGGAPDAALFAVVRIRRFRHDSLLVRTAALLGLAVAAGFLVYLLFFA
jgi:molecular chaperone DnaJ